ncbi:TPA: hypothetical protein U2N26_002968 [Acinetobacter nosocomialis]|uniref:hypothetical protein n=1 Tax=Acinetobacter nosocomialis TaxID=106654 RepID=UPI001901E05D|nr:hypothetical protein [Acinetobacter nosocomialis]MBJ8460502.1 hypothetical protein [Acinetobacter nosocomialis]HEM7379596.1 hypothetical protein [Acinetobacter nosocomialis]HEM8428611.1 hypothetical protein [Acinetobacter nosocomialis]
MTDLNKGSEVNLRFEQDDCAVWVFDGDSHQGTEISHLMMMHSDEYNEDEIRVICHHAACEIDRLRAELEKAKAQAVPEKKIYLTCEQLYAAANFGAPNKDPELLETELTIAWFDEAHSGSGYYVYISEYPEEGAMKLDIESGVEG